MTISGKFIICKGSSGLGNRILAASTAILYSQITHKNLIIDWSDGSYSENRINVFPLFFEAPKTHALESIESIKNSTSVYPYIWLGKLDKSFGSLKNEFGISDSEISFDVAKTDYSENILVFGAYTHKIYKMRHLFKDNFDFLNSLETPDILRYLFSNNLRLHPDIRHTVDTFKSDNFDGKVIGVHVRQTDMKIPIDDLVESTIKISKRQKTNRIFLASDSQEVIKIFEKYFDVITYQKWFPPDGERMHQNWDSCPDRIQNGKEALADLYLLAECDDLVFSSQSSFGYVASLLSKAGKKHSHDVTKSSFLNRVQAKLKKMLR